MQEDLFTRDLRRVFSTGPSAPKGHSYSPTAATNSLMDLAHGTSPYEIRAKICQFEREMFKLADRYTELPTEHMFAPQVYMRKVWLQKGHAYVGKIHRHEHANIVSSGLVAVVTEFEPYTVYRGHCMFISPAYTKRALVALEDTVWTCIHTNPSNITDLTELEEFNVAKSYTELGMADPVLMLEGVQ
jgi:hypothetical protein